MRSFFLKLFLCFWLAATVIGLVIVTTIRPLVDPGSRPAHGRPMPEMETAGRSVLRLFEKLEPEAFAETLAEMEKATGTRLFLVPVQEKELPAGPFPADPRQRQEIAKRIGGDRMPDLGVPLQVQHLVGADEKEYLFVVAHRQISFWRNPRIYIIPATINFFAAGILCGWLAWYLTAPLRRLRQATLRLAAGDLSARSGLESSKGKDELAQLGRDFDHMAGRIEALVTAQKVLLRDISHELRSPLARLNVALEMVRQQAGDAARIPLERIGRETERINDLIGDILCLCRSETDLEAMRPVSIDISALVQEVVADANFEARSRGVSVLVESIPCTVTGIPELLRSALENVIRNAVRYTREGTQVEVALRCVADADLVSITIRDHGPGVPVEDLERIFQPFYRVDSARDRRSGGTGLGLAIVDRAIRMQGGEVRAANALDGGLIVEMNLPFRTSGRSSRKI